MKVGNYLKHLNKYCVNFAENTYTISDIIFWPFTLFSSEGNSLQVKRNLKSSVTNFLSSLPSKNKCLAIAVETYVKAGIKVFWCCSVLLDFITFGKVFCHWLSDKPNLCSYLDPVSLKPYYLNSLPKRLCLTFRGNINKMIWGKSFKFCSFLQVLFLHVCFRSKFNIRKISTAVGGGFLVDFSVYCQNKTISRDFINAISSVFVWGQFTISKTELEI